MASYTVTDAKHATLTATTQDTVSIASSPSAVGVSNRAGTESLSVRAKRGTTCSDIVALLEDDVTVIPPGGYAKITCGKPWRSGGTAPPTIVKIRGNGNAYSVEAAR